MTDLTKQKCIPCEGGTQPLTAKEYLPYLEAIKGWRVKEGKRLEKQFVLADFKTALDFVNQVGYLAEQEGHHPDIYLHSYKKVTISLSTHAIGGLSVNDFILASKIDQLDIILI